MYGNILNNYMFNGCDLRLSSHKFYDLYLSNDHIILPTINGFFSGKTLISYFDFNNENIYSSGITSANTIYSLTTWDGAINSGDTLYDIGLTGIDNGLVVYDKLSGDTNNSNLISAMTQSTLTLVTGDTRLQLNSVTGNSNTYIYPINILSSTTIGNYAQLCGGFYQGFYKLDGFNYEVLPNRVEKGWVTEFWLNKTSGCTDISGTTLNDIYPDNSGFFLYFGTRSENKFWNTFNGLNTGCTSGCTSGDCINGEIITSGCTIPKEINSTTSTGLPINPSSYHVDEICNQFLIYDRTSSGFTACNFEQGDCISITGTTTENLNRGNEFLLYDRSVSGNTACYDNDRMISITETDRDGDIVDNAIGFRIKDDGSIGYRLLTYSGECSGGTITGTTITGVTIEEGYSLSGMVSNDVWTHIAIRFVADVTMNECELKFKDRRPGRLYFYVNGKLKYAVNINEFVAKRLSDDITKQEGVPFNISIGGGTQGLIDSQTFDGPDPDDKKLSIEKYFAGTFIGGISKFRLYNDSLCYCTIQNNYNSEKNDYI